MTAWVSSAKVAQLPPHFAGTKCRLNPELVRACTTGSPSRPARSAACACSAAIALSLSASGSNSCIGSSYAGSLFAPAWPAAVDRRSREHWHRRSHDRAARQIGAVVTVNAELYTEVQQFYANQMRLLDNLKIEDYAA